MGLLRIVVGKVMIKMRIVKMVLMKRLLLLQVKRHGCSASAQFGLLKANLSGSCEALRALDLVTLATLLVFLRSLS